MKNKKEFDDTLIKLMTNDDINLTQGAEILKKQMLAFADYCGSIGAKTGTFMIGSTTYLENFLKE